jgi:pimeloyl-ACP methyl ester carboxylesterase
MSQPNDAGLIAQLDACAIRHECALALGGKMVWRRWGRGRPLVLLHGGAGSWMHWVRNIQQLATTRTVWVPDLPGFGDSDLPDGAKDADSLVPYLVRGLREVLPSEKFDLMGFSFGALVAALLAAESQMAIDRMVLVSVNGMGLVGQTLQLKRLAGVVDPAEREAVIRHNLAAVMMNDPSSVDDLAMEVQKHGVGSERLKNRTLVLTDVLFGISGQWRCPVYAIWGRGDVAYRHQIDRLLAASGRLNLREAVILDDAGHWVPYERPQEFHQLVSRFL